MAFRHIYFYIFLVLLSVLSFRTKIGPGLVQREALLFAKRLTGDQAKGLGLVDVVIEESKMAEEAKKLIKMALGRNGLDREALGMMKKDIYGETLVLSKL